jgi:hypothetical protein
MKIGRFRASNRNDNLCQFAGWGGPREQLRYIAGAIDSGFIFVVSLFGD